MSRYHRINIDGKSMFKTETRLTAASSALLPGTFAIINGDDAFEEAPVGTVGRVYVIDANYHEGKGVRDVIAEGVSAIGNYVEEGRELAILCPAGVYHKDEPIAIGADGKGVSSDTNVIGWAQDDATLASDDFIRVRMRTVLNTAAIDTLEVTPATASIDANLQETIQLTATISPANAPQGVDWVSSNDNFATVDPTGLVTAVAAGSVTITATSQTDGTKTDTATITVTAN